MTIFNRLYIHPSLPILLGLAIIFGFFEQLIMVYLIVLVHESAHCFTALFFRIKLKQIEILPFGMTMLLDGHYIKNPKHEIIVVAAGPLSNMVISFAFLLLVQANLVDSETGWFIITASNMIALMNIMPAMPLDGGRLLKAALTIRWGFVKAFNFTMAVTKVMIVLLAIGGAVLIYYVHFNFSLFLICAFLIVNIVAEKRSGSMMIMRDILYSKEKLNTGIARAASIAATYDKPARKLLKAFGYNHYYLVDVVDENMRYMGTLTETQIIDGLINKGTRAKLYELL